MKAFVIAFVLVTPAPVLNELELERILVVGGYSLPIAWLITRTIRYLIPRRRRPYHE